MTLGRHHLGHLYVIVSDDALHKEEPIPAREPDEETANVLEPHGDAYLRVEATGGLRPAIRTLTTFWSHRNTHTPRILSPHVHVLRMCG